MFIIWFHSYVVHKKEHRGPYGKGGKSEWEDIREGDKPRETLEFGKQTEGYKREVGWEAGVTG